MAYEVRYIEWVDSMGGSGWEPLEDMRTYKPMAIKTAGFVVDESPDHVTILQSFDERDKGRPHADNVISIPTVAITKCVSLAYIGEDVNVLCSHSEEVAADEPVKTVPCCCIAECPGADPCQFCPTHGSHPTLVHSGLGVRQVAVPQGERV